MASSLKNKLNALRGAQGKPKPAPRNGGLQVTRTVYPLPEGLDALNGDGLLRIGWTGRRFDLDRVCFLDTETTGLSGGAGTVAFLVGVGYAMGEGFCVEQLFMRDYSDEPELLLRLNELLCRFDGVVTFNGRRFDLPLLSTRCLMNRQENPVERLQSLDLLYPSRRLWKLRLTTDKLCEIGAKLGADVPFCIRGGLCRVSGIGEIIEPMPCGPRIPMVLLHPGGGLSTQAVFGRFDAEHYPTLHVDTPAVARAVQAGDIAAYDACSGNALEAPAISLMAEVRTAMEQLRATGAGAVRMSGSGSAVFGLFETDEQAQRAAQELPGAILTASLNESEGGEL